MRLYARFSCAHEVHGNTLSRASLDLYPLHDLSHILEVLGVQVDEKLSMLQCTSTTYQDLWRIQRDSSFTYNSQRHTYICRILTWFYFLQEQSWAC